MPARLATRLLSRSHSFLGSFLSSFASGFSGIASGFSSITSGFAGVLRSFTGSGGGFLSLFLLRACGQRQGQRESSKNHLCVHVIYHPSDCVDVIGSW